MAHSEAVLRNGERLFSGQYLKSRNGLFHALMQEDGNLVIYRGDQFKTKPAGYEKTALWSVWPAGKAPAGGTGYHLYMQPDGNLCIYRQDPHAVPWACPETSKKCNPDGRYATRFLEMCDNGRLDISGVWDTDISEGYGEVEFERIDYIFDPAPTIRPLGEPGVTLSEIGTNDSSVEQTQTLAVTYAKATTTGWKTSTTLKIGASTKVKAGIPWVAEGEVTVSSELSQGFEWNESKTKTETVTLTLPVRVPPGKSVRAKCTWRQSAINLPYRAVGWVKFDNYPEKLPVTMEGIYEGEATHDVHTWWKEVPRVDASANSNAMSAAVAMIDQDGWIPIH